jgi:hypothetical protein
MSLAAGLALARSVPPVPWLEARMRRDGPGAAFACTFRTQRVTDAPL